MREIKDAVVEFRLRGRKHRSRPIPATKALAMVNDWWGRGDGFSAVAYQVELTRRRT